MNTERRADDHPATRPVDWYVDHLLADVERFAAVLERGPLDATVEACPDWDVARLATHVGVVHRWAERCAVDGAPPDGGMGQFAPEPDTELAGWLRAGAADLAASLSGLDLSAATWHPFPVERVNEVWPRRMAHETAVHRWDAEAATGAPSPIDAELASDGIDEYFDLVVRRRVRRDEIPYPDGSLHVHCTDVDGEWLVWADTSGDDAAAYHVVREHQKGDAALRGPAEAILLRLWGRRPVPRADELSPVGDEAVLNAWLDVAGM